VCGFNEFVITFSGFGPIAGLFSSQQEALAAAIARRDHDAMLSWKGGADV
jgi:hypothetical protein